MTARTTILISSTFRPTKWSGGLTTELFIFPSTAIYKKLDFDFRLSTATVEIETTVFTPLEAVSRTLMVLEGKMKLDHEDHHSSELTKHQVDRFEGDWKTTSFGQCTDFNLMTKGQAKGDQVGIVVKSGESRDYPVEDAWDWFFVYVHSGSVSISYAKENHQLKKGDLLIVEHPVNSSIQFTGSEPSDLVLCNVTQQ
ncbi:MAG: HutD family protein [Cyclobacteriaceae bacterium]